jgi:hypothetical protein
MRYFVEQWRGGWGIWHGWRWFRWRVTHAGPFGVDAPWLYRHHAEAKASSLSNNGRMGGEAAP